MVDPQQNSHNFPACSPNETFLGAGTMRNICTHKPSPPPPIVKRNSSQPDQAGKHCLFTIHLVAHLYFLAFQQPKQPLCSPHSCFSDPNMALREAWLSAPEGRLCPWQQARALALREASAEIHGAPWLPWIAERLEKVGGGKPSKQAVGQLFALVDTDKEWYPGKHNGAKRGRKPLLTRAKRRCIGLAMM